jgi:hypothetical protein
MDLVAEAEVEHASAKDLIAQIEEADGVDESFDAKVKVLGEYIKHHVKEEEGEIFGALDGKAEELDALGQEMQARKTELAEELGLSEDEDEDAAEPAAKGSSGRASERGSARGTR